MACEIVIADNSAHSDRSTSSHRRTPTYSRIASSASVSSIASFPEYDLKPELKISDIKRRLSDLTNAKGPDLIQACRNFDRRLTNKIPKTQFRQVLRTFCFPITAAQFELLCNEFQLKDEGKIDYIDFFKTLSDGKDIIPERNSEKLSDNLPIDEVELRIKEKIKSKLYDVVRAFWLFDMNKDGLIQKAELRRILRNYCFDLNDDVYNSLWKIYDPKSTGVIKYKDFLIKLGINADRYEKYMPTETVANALCWSDKKSKSIAEDISTEQRSRRAALENRDDPAILGLPMEEIIPIFMGRLQRRAELLKNTFNLFDYEKNGLITLSDFRGIINFFVLPMSTSLFNLFIKRLDLKCSSDYKLYYEDFINKYCKQIPKCEASLIRDTEKPDCHPVVQHIKNHVLNPCARLQSVFTTQLGPENTWYITRKELRKAIEMGLEFKLSNEQFKELTTLLDPGNTNMIDCMDFLQLFDEPCNSCPKGEKSSFPTRETKDIEKYNSLSGEKLKSKIRHHLNKNILNIEKAILVCDPDQSGYIQPERLLDILQAFCIPLSEIQFEELISDFRIYSNTINYREFLDAFKKKSEEDANKWISTVNKLTTYKSRCPPQLPSDEVEEILRECIQARKTAMLKDFQALDVCNVGVACKDDVRNILNKFSFRFNDKQFEELWKKLPLNKFDQLLYEEFLDHFSGRLAKTKSQLEVLKDKKDERPSNVDNNENKGPIASSEKLKSKTQLGTLKAPERKSAKEILCSKAPHLKLIIDAIEPAIIRNFRTIRFHLHRADPKVTGVVDFSVLKSILVKSSIFFNKEEDFHILEYFDPQLTGKINYRDFLRIFVWYA